MDLSIVVPVYGSAELLSVLYSRIVESLKPLKCTWELILVNDSSPDESWAIICDLAKKDKRIAGIDLSRNFGQHAAISAGLSMVKGRRVIVMDCDLQDRPEEIPDLYNKSCQGFEVVLAKRVNRKDSFFKRMFSSLFYWILSYLTGQRYDPSVASFGCYEKKVVEAILSMGDYSQCFPIFVKWVGFRTTSIEVVHAERESGKSAYTFSKSLNLAINMMLSFSDKPLRIVVYCGLMMSFFAGVVAFFYFLGALSGYFKVQGWATIIISVWFLFGVLIFTIGIIGIYIAKIFDQTKNRPIFIIRETISNKHSNRG